MTEIETLRTAAQAVIDRWETPLWKDAPATAGYIAALRDALAADHTEHHLEMVGRWYMVTQDGAATLCVDRADAEAEARKADREWPRNGPHRAVRLVESPQFGDFFRLKGQRMVLCSLLRECLGHLEDAADAMYSVVDEIPVWDLVRRIESALKAISEDQVKGG